ncbi:hypothetical protein SLEP1_g27710 [Rubroshorea leprosula]|uniref:Uncharacterized protein n=1 Tax=Rubroshorea leprosula TaxID=152421 RepID=A0AAV5K0M8_9ROSI|nr:hypothetical protein SLEP1_g27710 [Rubroshorea leprosula]
MLLVLLRIKNFVSCSFLVGDGLLYWCSSYNFSSRSDQEV